MAILNVINNMIVSAGPNIAVCDTDPFPVIDAGLSNFTYVWEFNGNVLPNETNQTITATQSGTYIITVTASPACFGTDTVEILIEPSPVVSLGGDVNLCSSDPIPPLDAGNTGASFTWFMNGAVVPGDTSQFFFPTQPGSYAVIVSTAGTNCTGTDSMTVNVAAQLVVNMGPDQSICDNDIPAVLNAGVPNSSYVWMLNGSVISGAVFQTYQPAIGAGGTYTVQVTTVSGCLGTDTLEINITASPVVTLTDVTACAGATFGILDAGNPGSTYLWSNGATTQTITPSAAGTYSVTVTISGAVCDGSGTADAIELPNPVPVITGTTDICEGDNSVFDAGSFTVYQWSNGQTSQTINVTSAGTYDVTVTDADGCSGTTNLALIVNDNPVIDLGTPLCGDEINPTIANGLAPYTYDWSSGESSETITPVEAGTYMLTVTDDNGCRGTEQVLIECGVDIPNIFTPGNADGKNDFFVVKNLIAFPNSDLKIFNRWGNIVYESGNYDNKWDGDDLPDGTYFYSLTLSNGKRHQGAVLSKPADR